VPRSTRPKGETDEGEANRQDELTPEQQTHMKQAIGKEIHRLTLEVLEARLAPGRPYN
jgi:hypothetical protein